MPWNENNGGGGPWGSGGNNNGDRGNNPWGNRGGSNRPGGGGQEPPDLDELIARLNQSLGRMFGGGGGKRGGSGAGGGKGGNFLTVLVVFLIIGAGVLFWPGRAIYSVGPEQAGVVLRFGEYERTTAPGLHVKLPWPIETVELPEVTTTNTISIGANNLAESQMLTRDENIVDIAFEVQWRVNLAYADGVRDYLFNVRDPEATVRAVAESAMREVVGTSDLVPIITTARSEVSQRTRDVMQATLDEYDAGIQILQVNLQRAQAPQSVIDAFRDVDAAAQDAERARLNATAHANSVIPAARGEAASITQQAQAYRDSVIAEAQGQADRFVAIYNEYTQAPEVTRRRMFLETMEQVLGRSELIILDEQGGAVPYLPLDQLGRNRAAAGGDQ
ncbi:FtsH protease activity modulator HflK [Hyphobacterium marinum]|uniref:Protein HflK n=1 Tax=Hyphobacterium marinum TaxID=3116574 RepID=A0ABU7LZH7_9PROT|nr:FtsH protease activity modulator HflK [Hyphobacterium sp. Y6023]MEE2566962.1 FtsH protease activity modulator HflK [Hyphobacterium sp. Y6023]